MCLDRAGERIAFLAKSGEAGLGHSKTKHLRVKKMQNRTGVSGSPFLQKTAKHGLAAVKQGLGAQNQCILAEDWAETCLDRTGVSGSRF